MNPLCQHNLSLLAHGLAANGITSLRIDKRGIGASHAAGMREEDLRFDTYVQDAVAWLEQLAVEFKSSKIFIIGHSEGALVATLAAQRSDVAGLILLAGAGLPAAEIIQRQLEVADLPMPLQEASRLISNSLTAGERVSDVQSQLAALYRQAVQDYLISWFSLDPARELSRVTTPVLIIQGTTDLQTCVADAKLLHAACPDARLMLIEGMNHVLKLAPADRKENLQIYNSPMLPLAPELVSAISGFINEHSVIGGRP